MFAGEGNLFRASQRRLKEAPRLKKRRVKGLITIDVMMARSHYRFSNLPKEEEDDEKGDEKECRKMMRT